MTPAGMLAELREDNQRLAGFTRVVYDEHGDVADQAEQRTLFLFESARKQ